MTNYTLKQRHQPKTITWYGRKTDRKDSVDLIDKCVDAVDDYLNGKADVEQTTNTIRETLQDDWIRKFNYRFAGTNAVGDLNGVVPAAIAAMGFPVDYASLKASNYPFDLERLETTYGKAELAHWLMEHTDKLNQLIRMITFHRINQHRIADEFRNAEQIADRAHRTNPKSTGYLPLYGCWVLTDDYLTGDIPGTSRCWKLANIIFNRDVQYQRKVLKDTENNGHFYNGLHVYDWAVTKLQPHHRVPLPRQKE